MARRRSRSCKKLAKRPPKIKRPRADKVNGQAVVLLRERMETLGDQWREGCAVQIPSWVDREIEARGWRAWLENPVVPF